MTEGHLRFDVLQSYVTIETIFKYENGKLYMGGRGKTFDKDGNCVETKETWSASCVMDKEDAIIYTQGKVDFGGF